MLDSKTLQEAAGLGGTMFDDVLKLSVPRKDLRVTVDGFEIIPFMGLTSWVAFRKGPQHTTLMGDIVLLEDEIGAAVSAAIKAGLYVRALHNHFIRQQPSVLFMHVEATSDESTLGLSVRKVFDAIKAVRQTHPVVPAVKEVTSDLDTGRLEEIVGAKAESKDGVLKFTLGRPAVPVRCTRCGDLEVNAAMGYNTWAAFQGTKERAAVCGDFAMLELEVAPVIRELCAGGIEVVAVHNHMFFEAPRIIFLHYWGIGRAGDLAAVFCRALDTQKQESAASGESCCSS